MGRASQGLSGLRQRGLAQWDQNMGFPASEPEFTICIYPLPGATLCSAVQCSAVQYSAVQCSAVQCSAEQCSAMQCSAVQCSAVQCSAVLVWGEVPNVGEGLPRGGRAGPGVM